MKENKKAIIYQLMPRWFTNINGHCIPNGTIAQNGCGKFNDIDEARLRSIKSLGATHVWYTGIIEHATTTDYSRQGIATCHPAVVKGKAGSPYAIRDYYDVCPDMATHPKKRMTEFEELVNRTHHAGLKVIIDFVPNHVAREYASDVKPTGVEDLGQGDNPMLDFDPQNNFYYINGQEFRPHDVNLGLGENAYHEFPARATGNDCFTATPSRNDWYETVKLNYGVDPRDGSTHFSPIPSTWHKMLAILEFWASKGVDGFRCDMAHMVPVAFWHWAIAKIKETNPHIIFIAEIYDVGLYRSYIFDGGFDYLYDKVTLYDTLRAILRGEAPASDITRCWQTVEGIGEHMLNFLENHDEQRIASQQFLGNPFKALPALVVSATISTCPFLLYAGQELGEPAADAEGFSGMDGRTTIFDYWSVPSLRRWHQGKPTTRERKLRTAYRRIMRLAVTQPTLANGAFFDLMYVNQDTLDTWRQYAYLRHYDGQMTLIVVNFGDTTISSAIRLPSHAFECAHLTNGNYTCKELLTGENGQTIFNGKDASFEVQVEPHGAVIWHFSKIKG
ncbi:MAG: alpha amylase C-terminal domain-containing protein [Muribaculaceae bacterium]|nr:alpha amylase C-terminal domain-containing protein [Muribaculaceae bacterium]